MIISLAFALAALIAIVALVPLSRREDRAILVRMILTFFLISGAATAFALGVRG